LCGLVSVAMLTMHGAIYLTLKTDDAVEERARRAAKIAALATIVLFAAAGAWIAWGIDGYVIKSAIDPNGPSNPLTKTVLRQSGQWMANYRAHDWTIAAPVLGLAGPLAALLLTLACLRGLAFIASAIGIFGVVATAGVSMFPFLMPSNIAPATSLTVWDASSSKLTLFVMLLATLIFLPIVLIYTSIVFRALRGMITASYVEKNSASLY
jgi:cytochrome d ubiquinol oxidase subunit II